MRYGSQRDILYGLFLSFRPNSNYDQGMRSVARVLLGGLLTLPSVFAQPKGEIRGTTLDARTGQVLAMVDVRLGGRTHATRSDATGHFSMTGLGPGDYLLQVSTVGYRMISTQVHLESQETVDFQVALTPDGFARVDSVTVHSDPFPDSASDFAANPFRLAGNDLKNLGTVLADDPLRAVQAAPGVSSNDDFEARFSLQGAGFSRIGVYLDGIQLHNIVHTLEGTAASGSNSIFNTDLVQEVNLYDGAYPSRFGDSSAGVLDVHMRDGNRGNYSFRATANFADAGFMAEGPLGKVDRCSWIAGFRKSYLQYLLQESLSDPSMAFGFQDLQGRLSCRVTPANLVTLDLIDADTNLDLTAVRNTLGANSLMLAHQKARWTNLGWQYVASDNLLFSTHIAWTQESYGNSNPTPNPLGSGTYREWTWNTTGTWLWNARTPLEGGGSFRSVRESGYLQQYNSPTVIQVLDQYGGTGMLASGFLNQAWSNSNGRVRLSAGGRWDRHSIDAVSTFSPQAGMTVGLWQSAQLQLGWGQYVQFPEVSEFTSNLGNRRLLPIRSTHASAAVEQRVGTRMRLRATFYDRQDRDLLYQPFLQPRLINGAVFAPSSNPAYQNSLRGYGRGFEFFAQRSTANGIDGWISYAYGRTWMHDGATNGSFPSDYDQRHTVNAYLSYRIRPTVNVSARWTYGSGFPVRAFVRSKESYSYPWADVYALGAERNRLRIGPYERLDLRVNKSWTRAKWKTTLYGEVVNATNRANYRFDNFEGYDSRNRLAYITLDRLFPILPSVGIVFER